MLIFAEIKTKANESLILSYFSSDILSSFRKRERYLSKTCGQK